MSKIKEALLVASLLAMNAVPRFAGLGAFTSIDEPFWLRQSANFYYALGQREFGNTLYEYHPAVTTMWLITAGLLIYFPEYRALGEGYLKPGKVDLFLAEHGRSMLGLLIASRFFQVILVLGLVGLLYVLLRRLLDVRRALFATAFVSLAPFAVGQSRLLNHEAMLAFFLLVSLLAGLVYLYKEPKLAWLAVSGAAAGLGQLTKSSGMPIFPLIGLAIAIHWIGTRGARKQATILQVIRAFGLWLLFAMTAYVLVWPGMWVAPIRMLQDVYGNAVSYTLQGARTSAAGGNATGGLSLAGSIQGVGIYLNDLVWRTTPLTLLGLAAATLMLINAMRRQDDPAFRWLAVHALLLAASFVLLFGIQRGPKPPHYILTSYLAIDVIAALGLLGGVDWVAARLRSAGSSTVAGFAVPTLIALQLLSTASAYPYYISYYDPLVEAALPGIQNPTLNETGYGMGLDRAAAYLAGKPHSESLVVLSANGLGSFSYYFPGTTTPMNDFVLSDPLLAEVAAGSQYVVVDYYNQSRKHLDADLVGVQPEASIWLNGIDFLRIYRTQDLLKRAQ